MHVLAQSPHGPSQRAHPELTPFPPIHNMVVPPPHHPARRIPQGGEDSPKAWHHGPEGTGEFVQSKIFQGDQGREKQALVHFPPRSHPPNPVDSKEVRHGPRATRLPFPSKGRDPTTNERGPAWPLLSLQSSFLPPRSADAIQIGTPLTSDEIASALSKSSSLLAPGPDGIPYLTLKRVNNINPAMLLQVRSPMVSLGYHPASRKVADALVLDKPGKPSYELRSSFRIIVLLRLVSKMLERIIPAPLRLTAHSNGLIHHNQCSSLPGLTIYDACLTLVNDVKSLQLPGLQVSSLFLDIKAGFDNVDKVTLACILREGTIAPYLVSWIPSFLDECSCTLVFQGAPGTPAPLNVEAPQGSPISPHLFRIQVAPLNFRILCCLMLSYVNHFAVTVVSLSYRRNIHGLHGLFKTIKARAGRFGISLSIPKTELIHWRTPSQRHLQWCLLPIHLDGNLSTPGTPCSGQVTGSHPPCPRLPTSRAASRWPKQSSPRSETFATPGGGARPLPVPHIGNLTCRAHPSLQGGPLLAQRRLHLEAQHFLAQGAEVGDKLLLVNPSWHPG